MKRWKWFNSRSAAAACLYLVVSAPACAGEPIIDSGRLAHLEEALAAINLTTNDLDFTRDVAQPDMVFTNVRQVLRRPLVLAEVADGVLNALGPDATPHQLIVYSCGLLEEAMPQALEAPVGMEQSPVDRADSVISFAQELISNAFSGLSRSDREKAVAAVLGGAFVMEHDESVKRRLSGLGVSAGAIESVLKDAYALDPGPAATQHLAAVRAPDLSLLVKAASCLAGEVERWRSEFRGGVGLPAAGEYRTKAGTVIIGTPGNDHYTTPAVLIVDPGGDDLYTGGAGFVNGLQDETVSVILDLAGNDRYEGDGLLGPGAALGGVQYICDAEGDDSYRAAYAGQAAAVFGVSVLHDLSGDDVYRARGIGQAAAYCGLGLLLDDDGHDLYDVGFMGQAYAGLRSVGILRDSRGNDRYLSGGRKPDHDRHDRRYLSMAQGFAIGMRPRAGGGIAALVDLAGSDSYIADVFGQGASYWYSLGMLLDAGGFDTYSVHQYGQGAGIHMSSGLLFDGGGDDAYTGYSLVQGSGHDFGVGMLLDHSGNDAYTANELSQGRGFFNALGLLMDSGGNDSYLARHPDKNQGLGHDGDTRESPALGVLVDLSGRDVYSSGAENGMTLPRPDHGVILDVEP